MRFTFQASRTGIDLFFGAHFGGFMTVAHALVIVGLPISLAISFVLVKEGPRVIRHFLGFEW